MLPLRDDNPHTSTPYVVYAIIGICVAVALFSLPMNENQTKLFFLQYALIPARLFGDMDVGTLPVLAAPLTLFTHMFMHGGLMHIAGNMLYLWIFGDNVEHAMGRTRFIIFYLICGLAAAALHMVFDPDSKIPMVGASGAISGVLGAYVMLYPKANVKTLMFYMVMHVPAWVLLGFWFAKDFLVGLTSLGEVSSGGGVAVWAHVGGFIAGAVLVKFFLREGEHLNHKPTVKAWETNTVKKETELQRMINRWGGATNEYASREEKIEQRMRHYKDNRGTRDYTHHDHAHDYQKRRKSSNSVLPKAGVRHDKSDEPKGPWG